MGVHSAAKIIDFIRAKILSFRPYYGETIRPDRTEILYVRQPSIPLALNVGLYVKALCLPIVKTNSQYIVFFRKNINGSRTQHIQALYFNGSILKQHTDKLYQNQGLISTDNCLKGLPGLYVFCDISHGIRGDPAVIR